MISSVPAKHPCLRAKINWIRTGARSMAVDVVPISIVCAVINVLLNNTLINYIFSDNHLVNMEVMYKTSVP